jgi:hypothetical protein
LRCSGPGYQINFDSEGLLETAKASWNGQLRFPGGTLANFWFV